MPQLDCFFSDLRRIMGFLGNRLPNAAGNELLVRSAYVISEEMREPVELSFHSLFYFGLLRSASNPLALDAGHSFFPVSIPTIPPRFSTLNENGIGLPLSSHPCSTPALAVTWRRNHK